MQKNKIIKVFIKNIKTFQKNSSMSDKKFLYLECNPKSEHEMYRKLISIHNIVNDWGLIPKHIEILVYIIRYGYSRETKKLILKNLRITEGSLNVMLTHIRKGKYNNHSIKKLVELSRTNNNITVLKEELRDIQYIIDNCDKKRIVLDFKN